MRTKGSRNKQRKLVDGLGYDTVFEPGHPMAMKNGYVRVHRMVAYDVGLLTDKTLEVHHINGNKRDNRLENLQVLDKASHTKITWTGKTRVWTDKMRKAKSKQMLGNQNWRGNNA